MVTSVCAGTYKQVEDVQRWQINAFNLPTYNRSLVGQTKILPAMSDDKDRKESGGSSFGNALMEKTPMRKLGSIVGVSCFFVLQAIAQTTPALNTPWQWQLSSTPSASELINVKLYDVDGFDASASLVNSMHAKNMYAVCYLSLGTWENWRPDAGSFPSSVKGRSNGWPGEKWLDIRNLSTLGPIMTARFQMCKDKGFDAVEPDNIDGYTNKTGFPLQAGDQLTFNRWIANTAHSFGMAVALKNDVEQVPQLLPYFDFALNEECFRYRECDNYTQFITAGKPVFQVEYSLSTSKFCPKANAMNFNSMKKDVDLTAKRIPCR